MDPLDMRLLRALFRGGALQIGALDPRLSAAAMAQKIGAPRSTVQARVAHWRDTGFFAKSDVWPNPGLFGVGTGGIGIDVPDARAKPAVLRDLRLVDGVLGYFDHLGPFIALQVVDDGPSASARRLELISRLPGVAATRVLGMHAIRETPEPTPLQWRVIEALRAENDASLADLADKVGVGVRTFTRHYEALVDARNVWFVPLLDFSKFPAVVAKLVLDLRGADSRAAVHGELTRRFPDLVEHAHEHGVPSAAPPSARIELFLQFENAAAVDLAVRGMLEIPEVRSVDTSFPLRIGTVPDWFDERLAARAAKGS